MQPYIFLKNFLLISLLSICISTISSPGRIFADQVSSAWSLSKQQDLIKKIQIKEIYGDRGYSQYSLGESNIIKSGEKPDKIEYIVADERFAGDKQIGALIEAVEKAQRENNAAISVAVMPFKERINQIFVNTVMHRSLERAITAKDEEQVFGMLIKQESGPAEIEKMIKNFESNPEVKKLDAHIKAILLKNTEIVAAIKAFDDYVAAKK